MRLPWLSLFNKFLGRVAFCTDLWGDWLSRVFILFKYLNHTIQYNKYCVVYILKQYVGFYLGIIQHPFSKLLIIVQDNSF